MASLASTMRGDAGGSPPIVTTKQVPGQVSWGRHAVGTCGRLCDTVATWHLTQEDQSLPSASLHPSLPGERQWKRRLRTGRETRGEATTAARGTRLGLPRCGVQVR